LKRITFTRRGRLVARAALLVLVGVAVAPVARAQSPAPPTPSAPAQAAPAALPSSQPGAAAPSALWFGPSSPACGDDCFIDRSGIVRRATPAYETLMQRGAPNYWLMATLQAAGLGGGTAWYWIDRDRQVADWDFPSIEQRFTFEAWRYDNNPFLINYLWHPLNGTGFHVFGRANDLSLLESVGYGFLTSMVWEIGLEFREKVSINDVIVTTGVGVATGEFAHWLGRYLNSANETLSIGHGALRYTLGFPRALHNAVEDYEEPLATTERDNLGLTTDIWHRFYVGARYLRAGVNSDTLDSKPSFDVGELELAGELVAIPGYRRPGRFDRWFFDGNMTSIRLTAGLGEDVKTIDLDSFALPIGKIWQDISRDGRSGQVVAIGPAIAYRLQREDLGPWRDRFGAFALPGLGVDSTVFFRGIELRGRTRVNAEFVGIQSLPYARWAELNPNAGEKTILRKQGYYYGWGLSWMTESQLRTRYFEILSSFTQGWYDSDEGLDRNQEEIRADIDADDRYQRLVSWVRVPVGKGWRVGGRLDRKERRADLDGVKVDASVTRFDLTLGTEF